MASLVAFFLALLFAVNAAGSRGVADAKEFTPSTNLIAPADTAPRLEPINGTRNFRMHGKKGKDDKTWFDGREMRYIYCVRPAKCEPIRHKSCLGSPLPYASISLDLTDSFSQEQTHDKLYQYNALRNVPKCWAVIQPFLCAVFTPKCEKINGREMVYLPSLEMCKITLEPCRLLYNTSYFPEFLKCNETLYPSKCNNDVREEMKFNATGQCLKPLVVADSPMNYYKDIEGCGLQCKDPLFTDHEHRQIQKLIAWGAGVCLTFNLFTLATFIIDWHNANKYPALVIFYINFCFMVSCLGWLAQFTPGGREDIVCRKDGTLRSSEPSAGENLSCIIVFILVYYFLIAAMVWFVIFTYVWHMSFKAIGKIGKDRIDKKGSYFHLIAWSLPLVLTITIMALSEIDGNGTVGICFVGYINHPIRGGFLLGPVVCVLFIGGYFLGRGLLTLIKLKISSKEIISARASKKIRQTIVRMGICTMLTFVFIVATVFCHIHEFRHAESWALSLKNYIICQISSTYTDVTSTCKLQSRPSVAVLQIHLICLFASGIVMSSWVWTNSTLETWGRYFRRRFRPDVEEPVKLQKHKVIAQAFAKRKEFQNQGRLSISFHNSHTDPVGLKFDINSAIGSHDFSSTWANNLPRFVNRRYALTGAATSSSHDPRKNSVDSEISFSVRHVSVESRRNSIDSQVSVKIAEMKTKVASRSRAGVSSSKHQHKSRHQRRRDFTASGRRYSRKESSTSVESQIITAIQKGRHSSSGNSQFFGATNMQRRTGIGGMDADQLNDFISNGKLLLPFLHQPGLTTSEDDNASNASFKVRDSKFDVILKQIGGNASGPSTRIDTGCQIEEYHSSDDEKQCLRQPSRDEFGGAKDGMKSSKEGGRNSKNSSKSVRSKKSSSRQGTIRKSQQKHSRASQKSSRNEKKEKKEKAREREREKEREKELALIERGQMSDFNDSSFTSFCSELSPLNVNSSYSGISLAKTNSRNSKRSCDVGIQANAYEIATQTLSSFEFSEKAIKNEENEDIYTENHQLLGPKVALPHVVGRKRETVDVSLTEAEKLKLLLLPSK
ncbi:smoothened [Culex quinquefasciatus]|uniref:Protein smoothened n=1 Tax=Culex quinquefasciatus TaxID=7176 RepID=B0W046_CULQU|nr:smoothened [Culex quinquefasciatus]|eukprot:XP_001842080.1 smoothened [Culex quinquefasciatus]